MVDCLDLTVGSDVQLWGKVLVAPKEVTLLLRTCESSCPVIEVENHLNGDQERSPELKVRLQRPPEMIKAPDQEFFGGLDRRRTSVSKVWFH